MSSSLVDDEEREQPGRKHANRLVCNFRREIVVKDAKKPDVVGLFWLSRLKKAREGAPVQCLSRLRV
jgi:hypothetical protein